MVLAEHTTRRPEGSMRWLLVLGSTVALLAGCATSGSEPAAEEATDTGTDTDVADEAEEQRPADDSADEYAAAGTDPDHQDAPDEAGDAGEGAPSRSVGVEIGDFFFASDRLAIEVGETVIWTHQGDVTHNVTSRDESFVSDDLNGGETFTHTFDAAGSFEYVCTLHGQMVAAIEVS
jgi:plastocyanin